MTPKNQSVNRTYQPNSIPYENPWKIHKYEIFFAAISFIKIPILAYFFIVSNAWLMLIYIEMFSLFAVFCDYCYGSVIAKLCRSTSKIIISCFVITIIYFALATLLLFLKTGGNNFKSCADVCSEVTFEFGISGIIQFVFIPMLIVLISSIIKLKSLKTKKK